MKKPSYNHTRADGPYDPCDECLSLMSREDLLSYVRDLRDRDVVPMFGARECERVGCEQENGHDGKCGPWYPLVAAAKRVAENYDPEPVGLSPIEQGLVDALRALGVDPLPTETGSESR